MLYRSEIDRHENSGRTRMERQMLKVQSALHKRELKEVNKMIKILERKRKKRLFNQSTNSLKMLLKEVELFLD